MSYNCGHGLWVGWDGQPRAVVPVVEEGCFGQQCALVASPGKEVEEESRKRHKSIQEN